MDVLTVHRHRGETALVLFYLDILSLEEKVIYLLIYLSLFLIGVKHYILTLH